MTVEKSPQTDYNPPCSPSASPRSVWSKLDRDLTRALDVPIWSRITANPDIKNRGAESRAGATPGPVARDTLSTWAGSEGFHNTTGETSLMRDQVGHHLLENNLRWPKECKTPSTNCPTMSPRRQKTAEWARTRWGENLHVSLTRRCGRVRGPLIDQRGGRIEVVGTRAGRNLLLCI